MIGRPESSQIATAMTSRKGDSAMRSTEATAASASRFATESAARVARVGPTPYSPDCSTISSVLAPMLARTLSFERTRQPAKYRSEPFPRHASFVSCGGARPTSGAEDLVPQPADRIQVRVQDVAGGAERLRCDEFGWR